MIDNVRTEIYSDSGLADSGGIWAEPMHTVTFDLSPHQGADLVFVADCDGFVGFFALGPSNLLIDQLRVD